MASYLSLARMGGGEQKHRINIQIAEGISTPLPELNSKGYGIHCVRMASNEKASKEYLFEAKPQSIQVSYLKVTITASVPR